MSIKETLKTTGQQVANTAADAATKQAQQQIDKAAGGAKKQVATAKQTVDTATTTLTKATDVGQLKQGLTTTAVSAATSQLPSAVQPITNMAAQQVASTVGTLGTLKQKPDIAAKQLSQPITKTIEGTTRHSTIEASIKPARRIGAIIRIGNTDIEQFTALEIHEQYGTHHVMKLGVPSPNIKGEKGITLEEAVTLIGEPVELTITDVLDKDAPRHEFKMLVTDIQVEQVQGHTNIVFACQSPTCVADAAPNFETICDKNFDAIIKEMCKPLESVGVKTKIKSNIKAQIPFVCRYNETPFAFIKRMSSIYKQWCYFNGKELIIGEPETGARIEIVQNQNCGYLGMKMQLTPVNINHHDYNAETHQFLEHSAEKEAGKLGLWGTQVFNKSKKLLNNEGFVYNPAVANKEVLETVAKADTASRAAGMFNITGMTDIYELKICSLARITYQNAPGETDKMDVRIVRVTHHLHSSGDYENEFTAIPAGVAAPPPIECFIPQISTMEAVVVDTEDPKGLGRVKVCFVGSEKNKDKRRSNWMRVATPDAGGGGDKVAKNRGFVSIPEKDSHVKIDFENNDPHCPYVLCSVFHGKTAGGGGKGNSITSLTTKSGNTVTLHDDGTITIDNTKAKITLKGDEITVEAPKKITFTSEVIELKAKNDINIGGKNVKIDGSEKADLISSTGKTTIDSTIETTIHSKATVKVGAPSVEAKADMAMKVAGLTVDVEGTTTTNIKGTAMLALN